MKRKSLNRIRGKSNVWLSHYFTGKCSGKQSFTEGWPVSDSGIPAIEALFHFESQGQRRPCSDVAQLERYLQSKAALDLDIKNWAEDRAKGWLGRLEFEQMIKKLNYPPWVFNAVENQKKKYYQ